MWTDRETLRDTATAASLDNLSRFNCVLINWPNVASPVNLSPKFMYHMSCFFVGHRHSLSLKCSMYARRVANWQLTSVLDSLRRRTGMAVELEKSLAPGNNNNNNNNKK